MSPSKHDAHYNTRLWKCWHCGSKYRMYEEFQSHKNRTHPERCRRIQKHHVRQHAAVKSQHATTPPPKHAITNDLTLDSAHCESETKTSFERTSSEQSFRLASTAAGPESNAMIDMISCPFRGCSTKNASQSQIDLHYAMIHGEKPLPCPQEDCGKAFAFDYLVREHLICDHQFSQYQLQNIGGAFVPPMIAAEKETISEEKRAASAVEKATSTENDLASAEKKTASAEKTAMQTQSKMNQPSSIDSGSSVTEVGPADVPNNTRERAASIQWPTLPTFDSGPFNNGLAVPTPAPQDTLSNTETNEPQLILHYDPTTLRINRMYSMLPSAPPTSNLQSRSVVDAIRPLSQSTQSIPQPNARSRSQNWILPPSQTRSEPWSMPIRQAAPLPDHPLQQLPKQPHQQTPRSVTLPASMQPSPHWGMTPHVEAQYRTHQAHYLAHQENLRAQQQNQRDSTQVQGLVTNHPAAPQAAMPSASYAPVSTMSYPPAYQGIQKHLIQQQQFVQQQPVQASQNLQRHQQALVLRQVPFSQQSLQQQVASLRSTQMRARQHGDMALVARLEGLLSDRQQRR